MLPTELVNIEVSRLSVGRELGAGNFGKILHGMYCAPEVPDQLIPVALKQFKESNESSETVAAGDSATSDRLVCLIHSAIALACD